MKPILSIYIPTFNRKELLGKFIKTLPQVIGRHKEKVEVVISDNASDDGTESYIKPMCEQMRADDGINIKYHRNATNIGSCNNFLQIADMVQGEFAWFIGDDDFILPGGVDRIIQAIETNKDVNYFFVNYVKVFTNDREKLLNKWNATSEESDKELIEESSEKICEKLDGELIESYESFMYEKECRKLDKWEHIYKLSTENPSRIGTHISMHVFRTDIWRQGKSVINYSNSRLLGCHATEEYRLTMDWVFPHLKIMSSQLIGQQIVYIGIPVMAVGIGSQENVESNWPLIDLVVLDEVYWWLLNKGVEESILEQFKEDHLDIIGDCMVNVIANHDEAYQRSAKVDKIFEKWGNNKSFYESLIKTMNSKLIAYEERRYIDYSKKYFDKIIGTYIDDSKKIAIWGAGEFADSLLKYSDERLKDCDIIIVDGNVYRQNKPFRNYGIVSKAPEYLVEYKPDVVIIASAKFAGEITAQLRAMKLECEVISIG